MLSDGAKIRALIVDDEPSARRRIKQLLARDAEVEVVGECTNGYEAVAAINECAPDLLFLDVVMPEVDGFEVLARLQSERLPLVVFVTAHAHYGPQAFKIPAIHYLLKPFDRKSFATALERAKTKLASARGSELTRALLEELRAHANHADRILVKACGRHFFLKAEELDWIEAEDKYVRLYVGRESYLLREAIGSFESRLDPKTFPRINRSTIVNIDRVLELQPWFHHDYRVILRDGTKLMLSRNYRQRLAELLGSKL
ncbi:MAG: DNA-binding response regulator [Acidobacteria bacterium]|nr:MAG: DNA-binding response regulator [Acidobacteriota bacterium]